MRREFIFVQLLLIPALCGGCALPAPDYIDNIPNRGSSASEASHSPFTVDDLTRHINCEIHKSPGLDELVHDNYEAQITLSLKVEDNGGVTPNLSFLTPVSSFAYAADANLNLDRQQTYSTSYVLDLDKVLKDKDNICPKQGELDPHGSANPLTQDLSGDLGIAKIIAAGIREIKLASSNLAIVPPGGYPKAATPNPNFGSTVQFMLTFGFDTGPGWSLKYFKGPSGSSKGILNGGRVTTDNLIIAFASAPPPPPADIAALTKAVEDAQKALDEAKKKTVPQAFAFGLNSEIQRDEYALAQAQRNLAEARAEQANSTAPVAATLQNFTTNIILQNLSGQLHQ